MRILTGLTIAAALGAAAALLPLPAAAEPVEKVIGACDKAAATGGCDYKTSSGGAIIGCFEGGTCFHCPADGSRECTTIAPKQVGGGARLGNPGLPVAPRRQ